MPILDIDRMQYEPVLIFTDYRYKNFCTFSMRKHSNHSVTPLKREVNELREKLKERTVAEGSGGIKTFLNDETQVLFSPNTDL
jgi:hypothetical protein